MFSKVIKNKLPNTKYTSKKDLMNLAKKWSIAFSKKYEGKDFQAWLEK